MQGSLTELVAMGLASEPTLRKWLADQPECEWIIKRGDRGDAYVIDLAGAAQAWRDKEEALLISARERADQVSQFAMDLGLGQTSAEHQAGVSVIERRALIEEELAATKLDELRGKLVKKESVMAAIADTLNINRRNWEGFTAELARKLDLDRDQIILVEAMVDARLRTFADRLESLGTNDGNDGDNPAAQVETAELFDRA